MDKYKQFKLVDLILFTVIALSSEFLSYRLLDVFTGAGMVFSFAFLMGLIAIYRWGFIGIIVYVIAGFGAVIINPNIVSSILYHPIANVGIVAALLTFKIVNKSEIKQRPLHLFLYVMIPIISLSITKGVVIYFLDGHLYGFTDYFASQFLTIVITFIVLNLVVRVEGLMEDMHSYIQ